MTEFDNLFHKRYVGGEGKIVVTSNTSRAEEFPSQSFEDILKVYRQYVNDPQAQLPIEVLEELKRLGKIPA